MKYVYIQAFILETSMEGFNMRVVRRRAGSGVIQLDLIGVRPDVRHLRDNLMPIVDSAVDLDLLSDLLPKRVVQIE